jgi:uncharacterized protein YdeI (YjbR/CyaY-like superfamily)
MELGKTLYAKTRRVFRSWLAKNHAKKTEIWLVYYRKASGKRSIPYNEAVEEALCFGWIDSQTKPIDERSWAQRFSPRRKGSKLSPMNRVRVERLRKAGRMTKAGLDALRHELGSKRASETRKVPPDIERALRKDPEVWRNFRRFPASYRTIRVGWIDGARKRPDGFRRRLTYFLKKTKRNEMFGMVR